jgi:hypothetical protein
MAVDYRRTKRPEIERRRSVHFFGNIHVVRADQEPTLAEHFLALAERFRGKARNEQKASHKTECEQLATCYARLAEQFKSEPRQTLELPKP